MNHNIVLASNLTLSDSEIVYLYHENYQMNQALLRLIFARYRPKLIDLQKLVYFQFYYLPFELSDLDWLQYQTTIEALNNFAPHHNKTFKNYLFLLFVWRIKNEIRKCWNQATLVTSRAISLEWWLEKHPISTAFNLDQKLNWAVLQYCLSLLTPMEQTAIQLRIEGYNMSEITQKMQIKYRQVDNAIQRSVKKLKVMVRQNWLL